ncbi:MAG: four-carbon acid sugar kinase family protein [Nitrososphaeria archaeon]|nr:four-carbon acid sugar kinase family protein [Nitrososphaeria archaeon]
MAKIFDSVLIVADDFTGVNDTVVQFSKLGLASITTLNFDMVQELVQGYDVVGVTTESRAIGKEKSYSILYSLGEKIKDIFDNIVFYKKVDSTLRGNIVSEIVGLVDALNPDLVVFAPAFPKQGRITKDGVHMVNGVPVEKTYFGRDLRTPVKSSYLPSYFEPIFGPRYRHINLQELRKGNLDKVVGEFKILSFDVESDLDLKNIVQQILSSEKKHVIWVGSAGLAEQLAYNSIIGSVQGKPVLMAVGSVNELARNQVLEFTKVFPANVIQVSVSKLVKDFGREEERIIGEVSRALKFSNDIIIASSYTREQVEEGASLAKELGLSLSDFGSILAEKFGLLVSHVISFFEKDSFCGIYMTGGDIAVSIIKHLKLESFKILGEIEPGLPILWSKDLLIVTKAGGFGGLETLIKVSTRLKSVNKRCHTRSQ